MQTIDRNALKKTLDEGKDVTILNVLSEDDYRKEHIRGSENIPLEDENFETEVETLLESKDKPVIVYCASVDCSASRTAAEKLENAGFTNVSAYEGGMRDWKETGYPVEGSA